MINFL
jgi:hypothetical protein